MSVKQLHKQWRREFNEAVFKRDRNKCRVCGKPADDAHHITDRHELPNGGYVLSNGVSLCNGCHILAGPTQVPLGKVNIPMQKTIAPAYTAEFFYKMIGSSFEKAYEDSKNLMPY